MQIPDAPGGDDDGGDPMEEDAADVKARLQVCCAPPPPPHPPRPLPPDHHHWQQVARFQSPDRTRIWRSKQERKDSGSRGMSSRGDGQQQAAPALGQRQDRGRAAEGTGNRAHGSAAPATAAASITFQFSVSAAVCRRDLRATVNLRRCGSGCFAQAAEAARVREELKLRSQVLQRGLPRPAPAPAPSAAAPGPTAQGPGGGGAREQAERLIAHELAALLAHDSAAHPAAVSCRGRLPTAPGLPPLMSPAPVHHPSRRRNSFCWPPRP